RTKNPSDKKTLLPSPPRFASDLDPALAALWEWLMRTNLEDDKKRNPMPLRLVVDKDGQLVHQADVLRVPVRVLDFVVDKDIKTLSSAKDAPDPKKFAEIIQPQRMIVVSAVF